MLKKFLFTTTCLIASSVFAETPKEIKGTWHINQEATKTALMKSASIPKDEKKYIPMMLKFMKNTSLEFTNDQLIINRDQESKKKSDLKYKSKQNGTYTFSTKVNEEEITLTVNLDTNQNLNVKSSSSPEMDEYLWKKLSLQDIENRKKEAQIAKIKMAAQDFETAAFEICFFYNSGKDFPKTLAEVNPSPSFGTCSITGKKYEYLAGAIDTANIEDESNTVILKSVFPDGSYYVATLDGKTNHIEKK
jgi:hypothetical protein